MGLVCGCFADADGVAVTWFMPTPVDAYFQTRSAQSRVFLIDGCGSAVLCVVMCLHNDVIL